MTKKKNGIFTHEAALPKNTEHEFNYKINMAVWANETAADVQNPNILAAATAGWWFKFL